MVGFGEAIARFYTGYFKFVGRASRSEYWWAFLFRTIVTVGIWTAMIMVVLGSDSVVNTEQTDIPSSFWALLIAWVIFGLINFIPTLAISVRRFHDLDQTGWLVLVFAIANAIIGISIFAQLIWYALKGTDGPNQYGPDPLGYNPEVFG